MSDKSDFQKISELLVDIEDMAQKKNVAVFHDIPQRRGTKITVMLRLDDNQELTDD